MKFVALLTAGGLLASGAAALAQDAAPPANAPRRVARRSS
jgi:hypothetical protein